MAFGWLKNRSDKQDKTEPVAQFVEQSVEEQAIKEKPFFPRLKNGLAATRKTLTGGLDTIFAKKTVIDDKVLEEIEELLITSDIGVKTASALIQSISKGPSKISDVKQFKEYLKEEICSFLSIQAPTHKNIAVKPYVIMVVGVNGTGKTTTTGKLAARFGADGKKVLVAAADTFRAGAVKQLDIWADRAGAEIVKQRENADPAAVAYDSIEAALARGSDIVLVDTAGRLHTKINLMEELKKIKRTISKKLPDAPHETLLVLDATTGQNALTQAKLFNDAVGITGIALTKLDGTARGGIVVSICETLEIPLQFIGFGEKIEDLQPFDPKQFVEALF